MNATVIVPIGIVVCLYNKEIPQEQTQQGKKVQLGKLFFGDAAYA